MLDKILLTVKDNKEINDYMNKIKKNVRIYDTIKNKYLNKNIKQNKNEKDYEIYYDHDNYLTIINPRYNLHIYLDFETKKIEIYDGNDIMFKIDFEKINKEKIEDIKVIQEENKI